MRRCLPLVAVMLSVVVLGAQTATDRERARTQVKLGWESMKAEAFAEAAKAFQQAVDIDPGFEYAYYSLGRADIALKKYVDAIAAFSKSRDLYQALSGRQFSSAQEAQRFRNDRITEIDEQIRIVQSGPQTPQAQDQLRQLQNTRRDLQLAIQRGTSSMSIENTVPAWVSLSLGSAYFRAGKMADAEREYKATIAADPKSGEAHSNLAVVYMTTGRLDEAEKSIEAAKKAGFRVNPQLEQDIRSRKRGA